MPRTARTALALLSAAAAALPACGTYRPKAKEQTDAGLPPDSLLDAGQPDAGFAACADPADLDAGNPGGEWLHTHCNRVLASDNTPWLGRGANLPDTRGCDSCTGQAPDVREVLRRLDLLTDGWGANFVRLDLESYTQQYGRVQWQSLADDAAYLADVKAIVARVHEKRGVYLLLSPWLDPTLDEHGWPTDKSRSVLQLLAHTFKDEPRVLFAVSSQPAGNLDGALDSAAWQAMDDAVAAIRAVEDAAGTPHHLVAVQGVGAWGRRLDHYLGHPIGAGGGHNVVYETHAWDPATSFSDRFEAPAAYLPVLIGEFGPATVHGATMSVADAEALMDRAERAHVSWLAWTFHMRCAPNLLEDASTPTNACGIGMTLAPTPWGDSVKQRLSKPPAGALP